LYKFTKTEGGISAFNVAFNGFVIASVISVVAGMAILNTGCSRRQAGAALIVTESGVRLGSIFAGVVANPKFYQLASGALGRPGACVPKKTGLWDRISNMVSLRAVKAQTTCGPTPCGGSYFINSFTNCNIGGNTCTGQLENDFSNGTSMDACSGYLYVGGQACPGCSIGSGCAMTLCESCGGSMSGGGGGSDPGCDSDPDGFDCVDPVSDSKGGVK
jgi:hypothetical protein